MSSSSSSSKNNNLFPKNVSHNSNNSSNKNTNSSSSTSSSSSSSIATATKQFQDQVTNLLTQTTTLQTNEKTFVDRINNLKNQILTKQTQLRHDELKERSLRLHLEELNFNCESSKKRVQDAFDRNKKSRAEEPVLYHLRKEEKKVIEDKNKKWNDDGLERMKRVEMEWFMMNEENNNNKNNNKSSDLKQDEAAAASFSSSSSNNNEINSEDENEKNIIVITIQNIQKQLEERKNKKSELLSRIASCNHEAKQLDEHDIPEADHQIKNLVEQELVEEESEKRELLRGKNEAAFRHELLKSMLSLMMMKQWSSSHQIHQQEEQEQRIIDLSNKFQTSQLHPREVDLDALHEKQRNLQHNIQENDETLKTLLKETENALHRKNEELCQTCFESSSSSRNLSSNSSHHNQEQQQRVCEDDAGNLSTAIIMNSQDEEYN